jgi:hypothetical protein
LDAQAEMTAAAEIEKAIHDFMVCSGSNFWGYGYSIQVARHRSIRVISDLCP